MHVRLPMLTYRLLECIEFVRVSHWLNAVTITSALRAQRIRKLPSTRNWRDLGACVCEREKPTLSA
jgi:hypothetical protein